MIRKVALFYCIVWPLFGLMGQNIKGAPLKTKIWIVDGCSLLLDDFTLIPNSITINNNSITIDSFEVYNRYISLQESVCSAHKGDTLIIRYRTFNFDLTKPVFLFDSSKLVLKQRPFTRVFEYQSTDTAGLFSSSRGLDYRGSFSRGFSLGNSQSLLLNSNFDMQLNGDLGNGVKIRAAISDENLPIQAQGNTQQLQEFDKIFIQISKGQTQLTAGDYELRKPTGHFMNYYKKLEGLSASTVLPIGNNASLSTRGSFAVSRGKFARRTLPVKEGNQGPYRLEGNNKERFIIVLSGTEKVYFNGILLIRGYDYDYVIDYNRAEIIFSPTRAVARDSRVIVEFEYTDISYLRTLWATETEYNRKKWKIGINTYSEQDSRNATGNVQLDSTDVIILAGSGDDPSRAIRSGIKRVTPDEQLVTGRILYAGLPDPLDPNSLILKFTENPDSALYSATFTEVGIGNGDYNIDNSRLKNGRVYVFVGKGMGSYQPVVQLIAPEQKQMFTAYSTFKPTANTSISSELAMSRLDLNRRSALDSEDDTGLAAHIALNHSIQLDSAGIWALSGALRHEYVQQTFNPLNPYRNAEFNRDWNLGLFSGQGDEHLTTIGLSLKESEKQQFSYFLDRFEKGQSYRGLKHGVILNAEIDRFSIQAIGNFLTSVKQQVEQITQFSRPNIKIQYKLNKSGSWLTGAELDAESSRVKGLSVDTLSRQSFAFQHYKFFVSHQLNQTISLKSGYSVREDVFAKSGSMDLASRAHEAELAGKWTPTSFSDLQWSVIGRDLQILDSELLPADKSRRTLLGRVDYSFSAMRQAIRATTSYNTSAGQEPKTEYVFQKVETGQGEYIYIGNSENPNKSNILDFRYDPTNPLANYIRLSLTNNEFLRTSNIELNQNVFIEPSKWLNRQNTASNVSGFSKWMGRFSGQSNIKIIKKKRDGSDVPLASFFDFTLNDTSLVAYGSLSNHTLFFNRGQAEYDIQIGRKNNQQRVVQVSGREDRGSVEYFIKARRNVRRQMDLFLTLENNLRTFASPIFNDRNLDILIYRIKPEINIRPTAYTRWVLTYTYQDKKQRLLTRDQAQIHEVTLEYTYRKQQSFSLDARFSVVGIQFSGIPGSPIEYDLLEGLKNGRNYLWNVLFTKRLANNIDLSLNYEARKAGVLETVHVARVQAKATF